MQSGSKRSLWLLLALVIVSRLLFALVIWRINGALGFVGTDTSGYGKLAQSLLQGSFSRNGQPEIARTPGYPLLLCPALALQHFVPIALIENLLLASALAWLIWKIVEDILPGSKAPFWAVLLFCFEPVGFLYCEKILSETPFTAAFLLFAWTLLRFLKEQTYSKLLLSILTLGCATYVRPVPLYLGLWLFPFFLVFPRAASWRQRLSSAILFPILFGLTLAPWSLRNAKLADDPKFSSSASWNLYFMSAAAIEAKLEHRSFRELSRAWGGDELRPSETYFRAHPEQRTWSEGRIEKFWGTEARRIMRAHWLMYSFIHAKGCAMVLLNPGISVFLADIGVNRVAKGALSAKLQQDILEAMKWLVQTSPLALMMIPIMVFQTLAYYFLAFLGLRRMPGEARILFIALCTYFVLVSGFPAAAARYRSPIMPLVCICGGSALEHWKPKKPVTAAEAVNG